ncbi:MAG: MerR family DNA-binding protein, partial [Paracoccaceae bacterium]
MQIGEAAAIAELPVKTVRYYADIGLVTPDRSSNGYREYSRADARRLGFIGRARAFGFSVGECRRLLSLYEDNARASRDVKAMATEHLARLDAELVRLRTLRDELGGGG